MNGNNNFSGFVLLLINFDKLLFYVKCIDIGVDIGDTGPTFTFIR